MMIVRKYKRRVVITLFFLFLIFFIAFFGRLVKLTTDNNEKLLFLWSWDKGVVEFTNSVTGGNVKIRFDLTNRFNHFNMETDEKTENYYTSGTYNINALLKNEQENELFYCSIVGIKFKLGHFKTLIKNSCLTLEILWPPKTIF